MRDPKRIDYIIRTVEKCWRKNPDLRFNQLLIVLGVIGTNGVDSFYWEDDKVEKNLRYNME